MSGLRHCRVLFRPTNLYFLKSRDQGLSIAPTFSKVRRGSSENEHQTSRQFLRTGDPYEVSYVLHSWTSLYKSTFLRNCLDVRCSFSELPEWILMKVGAIESPWALLFKKYRFAGRNISLQCRKISVPFFLLCRTDPSGSESPMGSSLTC